MRFCKIYFLVCVCLITQTACDLISDDLEVVGAMGTGQMSLEIEHSFDNGRSFVPRGSLNIHSLRSSSASIESVVSVTDSHLKALENLCSVSFSIIKYE
jgi:hypothetical protein